MSSRTSFGVHHYAGEVVYTALGFCEKNKDTLQPALIELLGSSQSDFVRSLVPYEHQASEQTRRKSTLLMDTLTAQFKMQLNKLVFVINSTSPHYVRCINPNADKTAGKIDRPCVLLQLRTGGVLEAVRVTRMGFPSRFIHRDFLHRFRVLAPLVTHADARQHCVVLMASLKPPLPTTDYQVGPGRCLRCPSRPSPVRLPLPSAALAPRSATSVRCGLVASRARAWHTQVGLTKIFFRQDVSEQLEKRRERQMLKFIVVIQTYSRMWICRRKAHLARARIRARARAAHTRNHSATLPRAYTRARATPCLPHDSPKRDWFVAAVRPRAHSRSADPSGGTAQGHSHPALAEA